MYLTTFTIYVGRGEWYSIRFVLTLNIKLVKMYRILIQKCLVKIIVYIKYIKKYLIGIMLCYIFITLFRSSGHYTEKFLIMASFSAMGGFLGGAYFLSEEHVTGCIRLHDTSSK